MFKELCQGYYLLIFSVRRSGKRLKLIWRKTAETDRSRLGGRLTRKYWQRSNGVKQFSFFVISLV
jgi:hypothetical protein